VQSQVSDHQNQISSAIPDRCLRWPQVQPLVGCSRTTWWRLIRNGTAPKPHRISAGCVGWMVSDIAAFQTSRAPQNEAA